MLDVSVPLRAELEFSVDGMTAAGSGKSVVGLPWIGKNLGVINFILGGAGLDKRKYPMRTEVTCGLEEDVSIKMAADYASAVSMPSCPTVDDECVSYRESCGFTNGSLDCSRVMKLKVVEFTPAQYLTLKQTLKSMQYDRAQGPRPRHVRNRHAPMSAREWIPRQSRRWNPMPKSWTSTSDWRSRTPIAQFIR